MEKAGTASLSTWQASNLQTTTQLLDRARGILVQTATFGVAANDYEARSAGNFDEVAVTNIANQNGGIYIFEYRDGEGSRPH
ncbi:MAG: hypothetical protein E5W38_30735 [Mesorhizobium sp.]|nr:MAG: hypothetical protein E5W38_30735 [Mesorhizobium sp.]